MIAINTTAIALIQKNPNWKEDNQSLIFFVEQASEIEEFILNKGDKSTEELISCKDYLKSYKLIAEVMVDKSEHKFKHDILEFSLNQQVYKALEKLVNYFIKLSYDGGWSYRLCFDNLLPADQLIEVFNIDINSKDITFSKSTFKETRDIIVKGHIETILKDISKSYNSDMENDLIEIQKIIYKYDLADLFEKEMNRIKNVDIEYEILERQNALKEDSRKPILESAWEIEKYLEKHPNIKYLVGKPIKDVISKLVNTCLWYSKTASIDMKYKDFHDLSADRTFRNDVFYYALSFYPNSKIFKEQNGIKNMSIMGHTVTEEMLEVLYSYALTIALNALDIRAMYCAYSGNVTGANLITKLDKKIFTYLGRDGGYNWYTDFFKVKAYRATALHCLQVAYNDEYHSLELNQACLEAVKIATEECPELSLECFGLNEEIVELVKSEKITAKEAFKPATNIKLFEDEVMAKVHLIKPKTQGDKKLKSSSKLDNFENTLSGMLSKFSKLKQILA